VSARSSTPSAASVTTRSRAPRRPAAGRADVGSLLVPLSLRCGLLSFLSPCVLPLLPAYLSFMTGLTHRRTPGEDRSTARVVVPALLFVLGFLAGVRRVGCPRRRCSAVHGAVSCRHREGRGRRGRRLRVLMLGIIKVPWLYGEMRADMSATRSFGRGAALVMGMAFAAAGRHAWGRSSAASWRSRREWKCAQGASCCWPTRRVWACRSCSCPALRARAPTAVVAGSALANHQSCGRCRAIVVGALIFTGRLGLLGSYLSL